MVVANVMAAFGKLPGATGRGVQPTHPVGVERPLARVHLHVSMRAPFAAQLGQHAALGLAERLFAAVLLRRQRVVSPAHGPIAIQVHARERLPASRARKHPPMSTSVACDQQGWWPGLVDCTGILQDSTVGIPSHRRHMAPFSTSRRELGTCRMTTTRFKTTFPSKLSKRTARCNYTKWVHGAGPPRWG
jgi:hypothetical protein